MVLRECLSCCDVLLVPRYSDIPSRSLCDPSVGSYYMPIISSPMDTVYSVEMDKYLTSKKIPVIVHRYFKSAKEQLKHSFKQKSSKYRFFAVGSIFGQHKTRWIDELYDRGIRHFCIDMAHGDTKACAETTRYIMNKKQRCYVIAGNIATRSAFSRLENAGAWAIRVGIGSGTTCTTRLNTGFGVPLLTAVEDCATVKDKTLLIADGGIRYPGDIAKCIAFGADLCMLGRMLASTSLSPGHLYDENNILVTDCNSAQGKLYKKYRGMASRDARKDVMKNASVEGESGYILYTGMTETFIEELHQNLCASLSYSGCLTWKQFKRSVKKIKITGASWNESLTHFDN